jgi:hypothetical protein
MLGAVIPHKTGFDAGCTQHRTSASRLSVLASAVTVGALVQTRRAGRQWGRSGQAIPLPLLWVIVTLRSLEAGSIAKE